MKWLKTIPLLLIIVSMLFAFSGCIPGVNIDKDGNVTIKDESGKITIGKADWDKSLMGGMSAPKAKLTGYINTDGAVIYSFTDLSEGDAKAYIEELKQAGYTYNSYLMDDTNYGGTNKDGLTISLLYDSSTGEGTISSNKGEPPSQDSNGKVEAGDQPWNSEKMGGLPDPGAAIVSCVSTEDGTYYITESIEQYKDYTAKIKACGFTVDESVLEAEDTYVFSAYNAKGDQVTLSVSADSASITYTKNSDK